MSASGVGGGGGYNHLAGAGSASPASASARFDRRSGPPPLEFQNSVCSITSMTSVDSYRGRLNYEASYSGSSDQFPNSCVAQPASQPPSGTGGS